MGDDPGVAEVRLTDSTVVAICNQKGGVGKTMITLGLCAHTALAHGRALAVDVDPQANAHDLTLALEDPGYDVVHELDPGALRKIKGLRNYDTIYVDCPGSLEGHDVLEEILRHADYVIIPYDHEPASVRPTMTTVSYVRERDVPYRVLLTNIDPQLGAAHVEDAWSLLDHQGVRRFRTLIRHYRVWPNSLRDGVPITRARGRYAPRAQQDIGAVHTELLLDMRRGGGQ